MQEKAASKYPSLCQSGVWKAAQGGGGGYVCLEYLCYGGCSLPSWRLRYETSVPAGFTLLTPGVVLSQFTDMCMPN